MPPTLFARMVESEAGGREKPELADGAASYPAHHLRHVIGS